MTRKTGRRHQFVIGLAAGIVALAALPLARHLSRGGLGFSLMASPNLDGPLDNWMLPLVMVLAGLAAFLVAAVRHGDWSVPPGNALVAAAALAAAFHFGNAAGAPLILAWLAWLLWMSRRQRGGGPA